MEELYLSSGVLDLTAPLPPRLPPSSSSSSSPPPPPSRLPPPPLQAPVEVLSVIRVEEEVPAAYSGDNIKLKLKGAEEDVCVCVCVCVCV